MKPIVVGRKLRFCPAAAGSGNAPRSRGAAGTAAHLRKSGAFAYDARPKIPCVYRSVNYSKVGPWPSKNS
jgi:hypothetical protein